MSKRVKIAAAYQCSLSVIIRAAVEVGGLVRVALQVEQEVAVVAGHRESCPKDNQPKATN